MYVVMFPERKEYKEDIEALFSTLSDAGYTSQKIGNSCGCSDVEGSVPWSLVMIRRPEEVSEEEAERMITDNAGSISDIVHGFTEGLFSPEQVPEDSFLIQQPL